MSPRTNLTCLKLDHNKHCKVEFGTYVHIYEEHDNSLTAHMMGAIAIRPTGNTQGMHYFLNINSGFSIVHNSCLALPMQCKVILNVHRLAPACKKHKGIVFTDKNGNIIDDNTPKHKIQKLQEWTMAQSLTMAPTLSTMAPTIIQKLTKTITTPRQSQECKKTTMMMTQTHIAMHRQCHQKLKITTQLTSQECLNTWIKRREYQGMM